MPSFALYSQAVRVRGLAAAVAMSLVVPFANTVHAQTWGQYGVTVYALPDNFNLASGQSVNNLGQVAGTLFSGPVSSAQIFNVLTGTTVDDVFHSSNNVVGGINNLGQVVGSTWTGDVYTASYTAMLYNGSTSVALPNFGIGDFARAINDNGLIVGESYVGSGPGLGVHALAWSGGSVSDLGFLPDIPGPPPPDLNTQVFDVNNSGTAVGYSVNDNDNNSVAVVFDASGAHSVSSAIAGLSAINNAGVAVGTIITDADGDFGGFYRDMMGIHLLPTPGLIESNAYAIDDSGRIFGAGDEAGGGGGIAMWENNDSGYTMYFLNAVLDAQTSESNWYVGNVAVSDNGEFIAAGGCYGPDQSICGSFVFQADAPEPSTIVLSGSGLLFIAGAARWRSRNTRRNMNPQV